MTLFDKARRATFRDRLWSSYACVRKGLELRRVGHPRSSTAVVTAKVEGQTTGQTQVYVHDLDIFATVQLLEDTPAVLLSFNKVCIEHGYICDWSSGSEPRAICNGHDNTQEYLRCKDLDPSWEL